MKIKLLIILIALSSCTLNKQDRRHNRATKKLEKLVDRFPELLIPDTIFDTIRVNIPSLRVDTVVLKSDTISIVKDRWRVRIINVGDSVFIDGGCDSIFVEVPIQIPCDKIQPVIVKPVKWIDNIKSMLFWLAVFVAGFFILRFILFRK